MDATHTLDTGANEVNVDVGIMYREVWLKFTD